MANGFSLKLEGFDEILEALKKAPQNLKDDVVGQLEIGARDIVDNAKLLAPVRYGILRNLIVRDPPTNGGLTESISSKANYSAYVEFGTGTHVETPSEEIAEYALQFKGEKEIPGMYARSFFFPAFIAQTPRIIDNLYKVMVNMTKKVMQKA